jgi:membrane protein YqaA with SNARE-associated domain
LTWRRTFSFSRQDSPEQAALSTGLVSLFTVAFLAATLLPGSSEAALVAALKLGDMAPAAAIAAATLGNTLGSCLNWAIGRFGANWRDHPRFPIRPAQYERISGLYRRYGLWSLFFSWVPFVGDPLTVFAGLTRTPFLVFLPLVAAGKLARYLVVAGVVQLF